MGYIAPAPEPALTASKTLGSTARSARASGWRKRVGYRRALQVLAGLCLVTLIGVIVCRVVNRPASLPVARVVVGTVRMETIGPGTVQSRFSVSISSRVAGTLERVLVDVGEEVQKGSLLATVEQTELAARLRATEGAVASGVQDRLLARANLEKGRADLNLARSREQRARKLVSAGAISIGEADDARGALLAAEANQRAAQATLAARDAAVARLIQEQLVAETILSYTAITSPMAGVITRRALEPGSAVAPGVVVFQVVDASALWIATLIDQSLASRIEVGQPAIIHLRSGADVGGHVARIALEADPVTRELEVDVAFDIRPVRFAIHEEADVTILGAAVDGLTVPLQAVRHGPEGTWVYVVDRGRARRQVVRLGIVGRDRAQVTEGLRQGDLVVLTPSGVRPGARVVAGK